MTTPEDRAERIITAILVHGFENDAGAETVLREQQAGVARLLALMDVEAHRAKFPGVSTAYTVFADAAARNDAQQVLVTWQDVKAVMDKYLHVGQITSPQGDGSRPYAVFSKRDAAVAVAQLVNDRFNAKRAK